MPFVYFEAMIAKDEKQPLLIPLGEIAIIRPFNPNSHAAPKPSAYNLLKDPKLMRQLERVGKVYDLSQENVTDAHIDGVHGLEHIKQNAKTVIETKDGKQIFLTETVGEIAARQPDLITLHKPSRPFMGRTAPKETAES